MLHTCVRICIVTCLFSPRPACQSDRKAPLTQASSHSFQVDHILIHFCHLPPFYCAGGWESFYAVRNFITLVQLSMTDERAMECLEEEANCTKRLLDLFYVFPLQALMLNLHSTVFYASFSHQSLCATMHSQGFCLAFIFSANASVLGAGVQKRARLDPSLLRGVDNLDKIGGAAVWQPMLLNYFVTVYWGSLSFSIMSISGMEDIPSGNIEVVVVILFSTHFPGT